MVAHNANGVDSWVVLNSLVKEITELKVLKTAKKLISLSFRCGFEIVITVEVPQLYKFTCSKTHFKGSYEKIGREYGLQLELLKGRIENSVNNKINFADLSHNWKPYFKSDVLLLAFMCARNSMEMQKLGCFGIKDCSTEASLGRKCVGKNNKDR